MALNIHSISFDDFKYCLQVYDIKACDMNQLIRTEQKLAESGKGGAKEDGGEKQDTSPAGAKMPFGVHSIL